VVVHTTSRYTEHEPLEIPEHHGDSSAERICNEILAFTKLNWSTCSFVELSRFRGCLTTWEEGIHDAEESPSPTRFATAARRAATSGRLAWSGVSP